MIDETQAPLIERLREAYLAKAEQREPALALAREAKKILRTDKPYELPALVVELTINAVTDTYHMSKRTLFPEELARVQALERVFDPSRSYEKPVNVIDPLTAPYNPLGLLLQGPNFDTMESLAQYDRNIISLFSNLNPLIIATDHDTATFCLGNLQERVRQREFSGLIHRGSLGDQFHRRAMQGAELAAKVTLEVTNPSGPDYLVEEFGRTRTRHPLQEYVESVAERVLQAKDKAIAAFNPIYRDAFMLETK